MSAILTLAGVSKVYQARGQAPVAALQGVDLSVKQGEFVAIDGRSGAGKTTLLTVAAAMARPSAGRVAIGGVDPWAVPDGQRARLRGQTVGFVFQVPSLLPSLTALENVALPTLFSTPQAKADALARAEKLLGSVGLAEKAGVYPRQLSAGQQQRLVIARALINGAPLLLVDEPTSNLDERTAAEIMALLGRLHAEAGVTLLLVSHRPQLGTFATRALHMAGGRLCAE